ncbi:MAG TPA: hypothetical protein VK968_08890 [Roseimicrobium sp.]|nr:hypothetical protein [Roseimicrobium sp.]
MAEAGKTTNSQVLIVPANPKPATNTVASTNDLKLHDIKPPVSIPDGFVWLLWILLAAIVVALLAWLFKNRRRWIKPPPLPAPIPPHIRARERLKVAMQFIKEPKPFCILVSDALRGYLEDRFQLRAPERTTEEFLNEVQGSESLKPDQSGRLKEFLVQCDLVKFAKHEPARAELEGLLRTTEQFIDETTPVPVVPPAKDQAK